MLRSLLLLALVCGPTWAHEPYEGLTNRTGMPCCGPADCAPLADSQLRLEGDRWSVMVGDRWWPVPDDAVVYDSSPDGQVHACVGPSMIYCLLFPRLT